MNPQDDSNDVASGHQDQNAQDPPAPQVVADNARGSQTEPMTGSMGPPAGDPFLLPNTLNPAEAELDPTRNVAWWMQESDSLGLLGGLDPTQVQQAARVVTQYQYGLGNLNDFQSIFAAPGQQPEEVLNPQPTEPAQAEPISAGDNQLLADITAHLVNRRDESQPAGNMPPLVTWDTTGLSTSTRPRTRPQQLQQAEHREASPQTTIIDPRDLGQESPGAAKRPIDDASEISPKKKPTVISKAATEYGATAELPINIDSSSSPARGNAPSLEFAGIPALPLNQPLGQLDQGPQPQSHPPATDMFQFMGNNEVTMPPPANNRPRSVTTPNGRRGTPRTRTAGPTTPRGTAATPSSRTSGGGTPRRVATTPTNRTSDPATPEGAATPRVRTSGPVTPRGPATPRAQSPGPSTPRNAATPRRHATGSRTPREAATPTERTPRQPTSRGGGAFETGSPRARTARSDTPRRPSRASERASSPQFIIGTEELNIAPVQRPASGLRALPSRPDAQGEGLLGPPIQAPLPVDGGGRPLLPAIPSGRHNVPQLDLGGLDVSVRQGHASHPRNGQAMTPAEYHAAVAASTNTIGRGGAPTVINPRANPDPIGQLNNPRDHIANIQHMRRTTALGQIHHQTHPMQNLVGPRQAHGPGMLPQETLEYFAEVRARLEARTVAEARAQAQSGHTQSGDYEQEQARAARAIPENLLRYSRQQAAMALTRGNMGQGLNSTPAPQPTSFQEALAPVHIPPRPPSRMILPSQAPSPMASQSSHAPVQGEQGQGYQSLQRPPNMFPNLYQQALGPLGPTENRSSPTVTHAVQGNPSAQDNISTTQNNISTPHGGLTTLAPNHPALQMPMHIREHEGMGRYTHQAPGYEVPVQGGFSTGAATQAFMPDIQGVQARDQGDFQVRNHGDFARPQMPDTQEMQRQGQRNFQVPDNTDLAPPQMQNNMLGAQAELTQDQGGFQMPGITDLAPPQMPDNMRGIQVPLAQDQGNFQVTGNTDFAPTQMSNIQVVEIQGQTNFQVPINIYSSPLRMPYMQGLQAPGQGNSQVPTELTDFAPPQMQMPRESISSASAISQMSDPSLAWSGSSLPAQSQSQSQAPTPAFTSLENFYGDAAMAQQQQQHNQMLAMGAALAQQHHSQVLGSGSEPMQQNQIENQNFQMLCQGMESGPAPAAVKNTAGLGQVVAAGEAVGSGAGGNLGMWDLDGDGNGQPAQTF